MVGYDRYSSKAAYEQLQHLYRLKSDYTNFFQPIAKLMIKERIGAKVKKTYDLAQTPYQRVLAMNILNEAQRRTLEQRYSKLNPAKLLSQIRQAQTAQWKLSHQGILAQAPADAPVEETVCG